MVIPLLSYPLSAQNQRVDGYEVPGDEQPRIYTTRYLLSSSEYNSLIRAAYRQIFNEQQLLKSNRQFCLESKLRSGQITVREFIRSLLLTESFRYYNYESNNNKRFTRMCIQRIWGRDVYDEREKLAWSYILANKGLQGFVDALLNSDEYLENFGDDIVPYQRRRILPQRDLGELPFAMMPRYGKDYCGTLEELGYYSSPADTRQFGLGNIFSNLGIQQSRRKMDGDSAPLTFDISLLHPRRLAKGHVTTVTVQIYLPNLRANVVKQIDALKQRSTSRLLIEDPPPYSSSLIPGMTVIIKLFSPAINFSDEVLKELEKEKINRITFHVQPNKECELGEQEAVLSIRDSITNKQYESIGFIFQVDDFAFDHVSKPILSNVTSGVTGIGSLVLFMLTLLQKVDVILGVPAGTITAVLAAYFGLSYNFLYKDKVTTEGK